MKVPVAMSIWVAANNKENELQFFLLLKLLFRHGKMELTPIEIQALQSILGFKQKKSVINLFERVIQLGWIRKNEKTGYYIIKSFDKLRIENLWESRISTLITLSDLNHLNAHIGASLYTYLHKIFWRKVRREKSVHIKGSTYHFLSPTFNYLNQLAPIATTGVQSLYNISKSKASRLKIAALKKDLIEVKKNLLLQDFSETEIKLMIKFEMIPKHVIKIKGSFYLQSIDLITPKISLYKRCSLGT